MKKDKMTADEFYDSCETFEEWWEGTEEDWQTGAAMGAIFFLCSILLIGVWICG